MEQIALITQMRAGTHYMCGALRTALEATLYRPVSNAKYAIMPDAEILKGLHRDSDLALPPPRADRLVYFSHYYHQHHDKLPTMRRIFLIGFPYDSFYSDGIVYSDQTYDAGPSETRAYAQQYTLRFDSDEWKFLSERMRQNAEWLNNLRENDVQFVLRYEDLFQDFDRLSRRLERFVGGFVKPLPKPVINRRRTYWSDNFNGAFDSGARKGLWELFAPAIERFYPEKVDALRRAL